MDDATVKNGPNRDRVEGGLFAKGNRLASGNPNHKRMFELRSALLESATLDQVKRVGSKLAELAAEGDVQAAKVWLEFVVGKPAQPVELTGANGKPLGMDWREVQATILRVLADHPEAKVAVALSLKGLVDDRRRGE